MADIKLKSIDELEKWNEKELRKLRITIKNRIAALELENPKALPKNHPLFEMNASRCKNLLDNVVRSEKKLRN